MPQQEIPFIIFILSFSNSGRKPVEEEEFICKVSLKITAKSEDGTFICCLPAFCRLYVLSLILY